ncbi:unnamed protein product, partial [Allacma fusca]
LDQPTDVVLNQQLPDQLNHPQLNLDAIQALRTQDALKQLLLDQRHNSSATPVQ